MHVRRGSAGEAAPDGPISALPEAKALAAAAAAVALAEAAAAVPPAADDATAGALPEPPSSSSLSSSRVPSTGSPAGAACWLLAAVSAAVPLLLAPLLLAAAPLLRSAVEGSGLSNPSSCCGNPVDTALAGPPSVLPVPLPGSPGLLARAWPVPAAASAAGGLLAELVLLPCSPLPAGAPGRGSLAPPAHGTLLLPFSVGLLPAWSPLMSLAECPFLPPAEGLPGGPPGQAKVKACSC